MSIISSLQTYIKTYSDLKTGAQVLIDYLGIMPTEYAIVPLPGARIVESYIDGSSKREYPFAFQSAESTTDDLERLESQGFFEAFADWLESQTDEENFPILESGKTATKIESTGWGYLFQQGESQTGIYNIQCKLTYFQEV